MLAALGMLKVRLVLASMLLLLSGAVLAQPPDEQRERALALGREALELYNEQRWVDAYERFERADRVVHSPVFVLYMARAQTKVGSLLRAREHYRQLLGEEVTADAPEKWREAQRDAEGELRSLQATIPRLRIEIAGKRDALEVWMDGRRVENLDEPIEADPGAHRLVVRRGETEVARRDVQLEEGKEETVALTIPPEPSAVPVAPVPTASTPPPKPRPRGNRALRATGVAALVIGSVAVTVGVVLGIVALNLDDDLAAQCNDDRECPSRISDDVDAFHRTANAATGTLIAGGVLVAGGIAMLAVSFQPTQDDARLSIVMRGSF